VIWGLDSRDRAGRYEPRVLRLKPRPLGFGLAGTGLLFTGDCGLDSDGVDVGLGDDVDSGERTSPASCIATCSSALVGSFIGDLVLFAKGDEDADCLPHKAVALFTEAKVDFSGDGSSLSGDASTLGGAISFSALGLGLFTTGLGAFAGVVGRVRENRDCDGAGDGEGFGE
jgi:hypothetical protein